MYEQWGSRTCSDAGSTLLYEGFAAGGLYSEDGGATTTLCMHGVPQQLSGVSARSDGGAKLYGAEYEEGANANGDVACAVCGRAGISQVYVQWGRSSSCSNGHTTLYTGVVMGDHYSHKRHDYLCMDPRHAGHAGSSSTNSNGQLWYRATMTSGAADTSLYPAGTPIGCSVCGVPF